VTAGAIQKRFSALLISVAMAVVLLVSLAPSALAAPAPRTHYWINSCRAYSPSALNLRASHALRARIAWHRRISILGFSECLFVSRKGTFVLLDLASSFMLSHHAGHRLTASQELAKIERVGGFPADLQIVDRHHTQFVHSDKWEIGLRDDVLGLATFGFFHRVKGNVPKFPYPDPRLYIFLNNWVMPHF